jgi:hypothetical protein
MPLRIIFSPILAQWKSASYTYYSTGQELDKNWQLPEEMYLLIFFNYYVTRTGRLFM